MSKRIQRRVALILAFGALTATSACVHVSQRVWYNGQAMTSSRQYQDFTVGDRSPKTLRGLYYHADASSIGRAPAPRYAPFGRW
jgi:hypothetical protein